MTNSEILTRLVKLEQAIIILSDKVTALEVQLPKYATQGQLKVSESNTKNLINQNSIMINDLQQQLQMVIIPSDTRYYLSSTEIEDFRSNYQTLIAMMADAEKLYRSIVSYVAQFKIK